MIYTHPSDVSAMILPISSATRDRQDRDPGVR